MQEGMWKVYDLGERLEPAQIVPYSRIQQIEVVLTVSDLSISTNSVKWGAKVTLSDVFPGSLQEIISSTMWSTQDIYESYVNIVFFS